MDQEVQQGKCKEVQFTAQISEKDKKGKWYLRNAATLKVRNTEYQQIWRKIMI